MYFAKGKDGQNIFSEVLHANNGLEKIIVEHNVQKARLIASGNDMIKKGSCSKQDCFIEAEGAVSCSF